MLGSGKLDQALVEHGAILGLLDSFEQAKMLVVDDALAGRNKCKKKSALTITSCYLVNFSPDGIVDDEICHESCDEFEKRDHEDFGLRLAAADGGVDVVELKRAALFGLGIGDHLRQGRGLKLEHLAAAAADRVWRGEVLHEETDLLQANACLLYTSPSPRD